MTTASDDAELQRPEESEALGSDDACRSCEPSSPLPMQRARAQTSPAGAYSTQGTEQRRAPRLRISDISEQRVMKIGVRQLRARLLVEGAELPPLPKRPDGSSKLLQRSFFERLVSCQIDLQNSMASEASAAQPDIRHLPLEHLLWIRDRTIDFNTESKTHEAHNGFIMKLEKHFWEQLASRHMDASEAKIAARPPERLQHLGFRALLAVGGAAILNGEARGLPGSPGSPALPDGAVGGGYSPPIPSRDEVPAWWLLPLGGQQWPDHAAALLRLQPCSCEEDRSSSTAEATGTQLPTSNASGVSDRSGQETPSALPLHFQLVARPASEERLAAALAAAGASGRPVGVLWDRSSGHGKDRRVHWEVSLQAGAAELLAELAEAERGSAISAAGIGGSAGAASPLGKELLASLGQTAPAAIPPGLVRSTSGPAANSTKGRISKALALAQQRATL
eukprot:TRINITY_DN71123_c0_g1_i1.p1 TRINITY_DN71123_c0_g1~~TRINITY_DN71123_c0_g1_i1.p1  ORF type:complete len:451 (-),score=91.35 TRINITY_DN71123_c0_g1_i1:26-1378(-)